MKVNEQLIRIRRFLRDPNGRIWDDDYLLNVLNDVHEEIMNYAEILKEVTVIQIPPSYRLSYFYDWEYAYISTMETGFYQALRHNHQADLVYCHDWELQQVWGIAPDVSAAGAMFTQPFEAWYLEPDDAIKIRFPVDFRAVEFIAYDKEPIDFRYYRTIKQNDSQYLTTTGTPVYYYRPDELDNSFVLYPRPTTASWTDGEGMALFSSEDETLESETGLSLRRTYSTLSSNTGLDLNIPTANDNVFLVYSVAPFKLGMTDESPLPKFLHKYIEHGVLAYAYTANTDGKIQSLADLWSNRFEYAKRVIKKYMSTRMAARVYRLGHGKTARRNKHPRLPSTYPNVDNF